MEVSLYSYVLASVQYPGNDQRLNLSPAFAWLGPIDQAVFLGSRPQDHLFAKITEDEASRRREWMPISQRDAPLNLSDVMSEASMQFRYHTPSEFPPKKGQSKFENKRVASDKGIGNGKPKGGKYDSYG